jgi:hypothetical protein
VSTFVNSLSDLLAGGRAWFDDQVAQTERMRPLFAFAAGIVFIAFLSLGIGLADSRSKSLRATQADLIRLKQQTTDGSWAERKQQSETMKFQLAQRFWTAETAGLAEASLERWLRERIEKQGVRADSIRIQRSAVSPSGENTSISALEGAQRMTAKVIMQFEPEALVEILNDAASFEKLLVVDRLLVRGGRNAIIELDLSTVVKLPEGRR